MKTAVIFALCFSSMILSGLAAADTNTVTITDAVTQSTNLPITLKAVGAQTSPAQITTNGGTFVSTGATAVADNTYSVTWTKGYPIKATYANAASGSAGNDYVIINTNVGEQIITVTAASTASPATTGGAVNAALTATQKCGDYLYNPTSGALSFYLADKCTVTVQQNTGVVGVLQYSDSSVSTDTQNLITTAISKVVNGVNGVSGATTTIVGTGTGSTLLYYQITGPTSSQISSVVTAVQNAINSKTIAVSGATLLNGLAADATASATASTDAPSNNVQSKIAAVTPKAHSRMVVVVGVFSTIVAALFGLAF